MDAAKREIDANGFRVSRRSGRLYSKHGNPHWKPALEAANRARREPEQVADAIAVMVRGLRAQGLSFRQIAGKLNQRGVQTSSKAQWHPSSVRAAVLRSYPEMESREEHS